MDAKNGPNPPPHLASPAARGSRCSRGFVQGIVTLTVAWGMAIPGIASAQLVGDRVRVALSDRVWTEGVVVRITPDELELSFAGGSSRVLASTGVMRIERRTLQRQWKWGFVGGAAVGGAFGFLAPVAFVGGVSWGNVILTRGMVMFVFAAAFAVPGTAVGGLLKREAWEPLQGWPRNTGTPRLLLGPHTMANGNTGFVLGARFRF